MISQNQCRIHTNKSLSLGVFNSTNTKAILVVEHIFVIVYYILVVLSERENWLVVNNMRLHSPRRQ